MTDSNRSVCFGGLLLTLGVFALGAAKNPLHGYVPQNHNPSSPLFRVFIKPINSYSLI